MTQLINALDVLIWPPGETEPVLAGQVRREWDLLSFTYDRDYLADPRMMSIFQFDLKTRFQSIFPTSRHVLAPSLRDALPDRWGRRAIAAGLNCAGSNPQILEDELDEMLVMAVTGPDGIGALEFREPGSTVAMQVYESSLEDLCILTGCVENGERIPPELTHLVSACASVGGARPKALFTDVARNQKLIAKFSAREDSYPVVRGEFVAMRLAQLAGIDVADVKFLKIGLLDVLLIKRFDRLPHRSGRWARRSMVSALTWTQESELSAHHLTYAQLADVLEGHFEHGHDAQLEMFTRLMFNVLVGNTDDHARNHAAFWDGCTMELTPAYDIAPQRRTSREANQAMVIAESSRAAQLENVAAIAPSFGVTGPEFARIKQRLVETILDHWSDVCNEAGLSRAERASFAGRQFFNEYAFTGQGKVPKLRI